MKKIDKNNNKIKYKIDKINNNNNKKKQIS